MVPAAFDARDVERFCRAALIGLRALDVREGRGRRFGSEADARWESFRGHLHFGSRIELLLRDGAVVWGVAFSPALAYRLPSIAEDEPFGPDWPGLDRDTGRRLWREALETPPSEPAVEFDRMMNALDLRWAGGVTLDAILPATHILASGPSAVRALVTEFQGRSDLDWSEQVVVVSDDPKERQLAGLAAVLLEASRATQVIDPLPEEAGPGDTHQKLREIGVSMIDVLALSTDSCPAGCRFAQLLSQGS